MKRTTTERTTTTRKTGKPILTQKPENNKPRPDFETVKREFEKAYAAGGDYSRPLYALAEAVTYAVLNKVNDPQRKSAVERDEVSNNGSNPALVALKRGVAADRRLLDSTAAAINAATAIVFDGEGNAVTRIIDSVANEAAARLAGECLSDSMDLVHEAVAALLELAEVYGHTGAGWLDRPYTSRRLSRKVYTRRDTSPVYTDFETFAIRETFRAVRGGVAASRAVQTDPRNGYSYVEELTDDGIDIIYYRSGRYADLGGSPCNGRDVEGLPGAPAGYGQGADLYTVGEDDMDTTAALVARLKLTERQAVIIKYRLSGYSVEEISGVLGVTRQTIYKAMHSIQDRAAAMGFTPRGWTPEARTEAADTARAVVQLDRDFSTVGVYPSAVEASKATGINKGSISAAAGGKRSTAGGYMWRYLGTETA